ncbi:hypothetical protein H072_11574 [Dactylellina haptotyla CBS 200.50]|uniref:NAD(P)-binding protein n=1 Tax=Dactylellina haptotyla (strain CBS 200.50) TaxID=1284197 RepID=S7ZX92_DACHA|nr:hypothetical protein H072_11574 [Dactylellina haptotyla CBS 200.50]
MSFSRVNYGQETNADDVAQFLHNEIVGKTIVITGVSPSTLGSEFALTVSAHSPKLVVIASRDTNKLNEVVKDINAKYPNVDVRTLQLDLASLEASRKAGQELASWEDVEVIDVLVNNAGIMAVPYKESVDGFEFQFATNHLGHFVFTKQLMPKIIAAAKAGREPRIVNVSSSGHRTHGMNWEDVGFHGGKTYNMWDAYGQSKTANILFSVELAEKYGSQGLYSYSLHPGMCIGSNLGKHIPMQEIQDFLQSDRAPEPDADSIFKNLQQGVSTHVVASFDPEIKGQNGEYLLDCKVGDDTRKKAYAMDKGNAKRLWELSEQLTGDKYD